MFEQITFSFQLYKPKKCEFPGCDRKLNSRGLCKAHYKQLMKGRPLKPIGREPSPKRTHYKEYNSWRCMISRCYNPKNNSYKYYGPKGITVCGRWLVSFWDFLEDMGKAPSPIHTLDRIDNEQGYFPANVRWATPSEQAHNTIKCKWIVYKGETMLVGDLAKKVRMKIHTLKHRIFSMGMTPEEAAKRPLRGKRRKRR